MKPMVPVGLSNRHVHLSQDDVDVLFGKGHQLQQVKALAQPGQFACEEKVDLVGPKNTIKGVRVLGPVRNSSQVEISISDGFALGVKAPIRPSGQHEDTPGIKLVGPKGEVELEKGVIVASRHIHMSPSDANEFGVKNGEFVKIKVQGDRGLVFENVRIRVNNDFALEAHFDIEEGNAAGLKNGNLVELIKENDNTEELAS